MGQCTHNAVKHKETIVHKRFQQQKLPSLGVRRQTDHKRRRKQRRGQTRSWCKNLRMNTTLKKICHFDDVIFKCKRFLILITLFFILMYVFILNIFYYFLHQLLLVCLLLCFLLLLSVCLLTPGGDSLCRKLLCTIVSLCFIALVSTFPQICCVLSTSPAVVHSFHWLSLWP